MSSRCPRFNGGKDKAQKRHGSNFRISSTWQAVLNPRWWRFIPKTFKRKSLFLLCLTFWRKIRGHALQLCLHPHHTPVSCFETKCHRLCFNCKWLISVQFKSTHPEEDHHISSAHWPVLKWLSFSASILVVPSVSAGSKPARNQIREVMQRFPSYIDELKCSQTPNCDDTRINSCCVKFLLRKVLAKQVCCL